MISKLRIWRVVPTSETGAQAPTFLVETQGNGLEKAEREAIKIAEERCVLSKFDNWYFQVEKLARRKDKFGRYVEYYQ